jgi:tetratricopeptide (TPR) repeat protein
MYKISAQNVLTDSDALEYYLNPTGFINKNVNFTGKILNLIPPTADTLGLQMHQAGDLNRNTLVTYTTPMQLLKDDCIRVFGISEPLMKYQNVFGVELSAAAIKANSIERIDCSDSIEPAIDTVNVNQTKVSNNIIITLYKIEFSDRNTRAYLSVENVDRSEDVSFYDFNARAFQEKTQFIAINSYDVNYPKIESVIPPGILEEGVVLFEPLDPTKDKAQFRFEASKGFENTKFLFDVFLSSLKKYDPNTDNITALINAGDKFRNIGELFEAIKYYDKALTIDGNNTDALIGKASSLLHLGDSKGSYKLYNKATTVDPNVFVN